MKRIKNSFLIIFAIFMVIFTFLYTQQGDTLRSKVSLMGEGEKEPQTPAKHLVWEPKPRFIARGNDGQLGIRASEAMSLLYTAHNKNGKQDLFLSKSHNVGDTFSESIRVNSEAGEVSGHGENGPKLRQGKGRRLFSVWVGNRDIKFARSVDFGRSFTPAIRVNDDTGEASQSFFAMEIAPDGTPFIAWLDGRDKKTDSPGTSSLYIAYSLDGGATFEKNVKVAKDVCPCCHPSIAFGDGGEIFVSWRHVYEGDERTIVVASSVDGGATWSDPKPVSAKGWILNGCPHAGPTMQYVDGKLMVVWFTGMDGKISLKMTYSLDKGKTFESVQEIQGPVVDANHPHMEVYGKDTWVIFQGRNPKVDGGWGPEKAWLVRIPIDGMPSKPESLPSMGGGVAYPSLFMGNGGRIYVTWTEYDEEGSHVVLCRGRIRL
jgi:hypothetical protein